MDMTCWLHLKLNIFLWKKHIELFLFQLRTWKFRVIINKLTEFRVYKEIIIEISFMELST